jgi:hypothetical protein
MTFNLVWRRLVGVNSQLDFTRACWANERSPSGGGHRLNGIAAATKQHLGFDPLYFTMAFSYG